MKFHFLNWVQLSSDFGKVVPSVPPKDKFVVHLYSIMPYARLKMRVTNESQNITPLFHHVFQQGLKIYLGLVCFLRSLESGLNGNYVF